MVDDNRLLIEFHNNNNNNNSTVGTTGTKDKHTNM